VTDESIQVPRGASVWSAGMIKLLRTHVEQERGLLEEYQHAAEETDSKALAYLVNLLIEDERRHHRLFIELARSLVSEAELSRAEPAVPRLDFRRADQAALLDVTDRLLARERDDARELKRLRQDLNTMEDTTLWGLLVDIMRRDTDKHIAILKFARKHIKHPDV